jgi:hypothetical protein
MRPIRATPRSDEPSEQTGGTPGRTGQRKYGSAPPHCEFCPRLAGHGRVWALASETPPAVPVPAGGQGQRLLRPAPAASCGAPGTGRATRPPAVVPPRRAAHPRLDNHHARSLLSPRLPAAWPGRHRLRAAPAPICRAPQGWAPSARPFFCRLLIHDAADYASFLE